MGGGRGGGRHGESETNKVVIKRRKRIIREREAGRSQEFSKKLEIIEKCSVLPMRRGRVKNLKSAFWG